MSQHPRSSVFHTKNWLEALQQTYDYRPVAFSTSPLDGPLRNGLIFCRIKSWITGRRLVSLPFSDHCDALADSAEQAVILSYVQEQVRSEGCKYAEVRPASPRPEWPTNLNLQPSEKFYLHTLSLDAPLETLFRNLHKDCIQRKVRRAEREGLVYEIGRSQYLLNKFYELLLKTRRRHCVPPQPMQWFRNLIASMGTQLTIRVASKETHAVAAMITLSFKDTVTYKYGCSDEELSHLGGTPLLFWKIIQEAKHEGVSYLDLGRSDVDNEGLVRFKDRLGAQRKELTYWRVSNKRASGIPRPSWVTKVAQQVFPSIPDVILAASGRFLYRHMG